MLRFMLPVLNCVYLTDYPEDLNLSRAYRALGLLYPRTFNYFYAIPQVAKSSRPF